MFMVFINDIPKWITEPNWVEYATLGGGMLVLLYSVIRGVRSRRRRRNLIRFPDGWRMERNLRESILKFQLRARVLAPYTSVSCEGEIRMGKRRVIVTDSHLEQSFGSDRFWSLELKAELGAVPEDVGEIDAKLTVTLDDGTKRNSGWRKSAIVVWPTPDAQTPEPQAIDAEANE